MTIGPDDVFEEAHVAPAIDTVGVAKAPHVSPLCSGCFSPGLIVITGRGSQ